VAKPRNPAGRSNGEGNGHDAGARGPGKSDAGTSERARAETNAAVREFLERRGCPAEVTAGGIESLVAQWEGVADALDRGYPLDTLDDYLNDMDARQLIEDAMRAVPGAGETVRARLENADRRIRALVAPRARCLWGDRIAASHGWAATREWWYFSRPTNSGPGLKRDLGD
jgi:hypothetical protein